MHYLIVRLLLLGACRWDHSHHRRPCRITTIQVGVLLRWHLLGGHRKLATRLRAGNVRDLIVLLLMILLLLITEIVIKVRLLNSARLRLLKCSGRAWLDNNWSSSGAWTRTRLLGLRRFNTSGGALSRRLCSVWRWWEHHFVDYDRSWLNECFLWRQDALFLTTDGITFIKPRNIRCKWWSMHLHGRTHLLLNDSNLLNGLCSLQWLLLL